MTSIKQQLDTMLKRSLALHGYTYKEVDGKQVKIGKDEAVRDFLTTLAKDSTDEQEMANKIIAGWNDKNVQMELSSARIQRVGNFIASESTFKSAFFTTVTLQPDEQPWYINETKNEMRVSVMGDDGTPEKVRVLSPQARTPVGLYFIASDIVRIKTLDVYRGDVSAQARRTIDIARDMRFKVDRIHYDALNASVANGGCYGAFSYEQARPTKHTRIYVAHSSIKTEHLPTTNDILNGTTAGITGTRYTVQYYDPATDANNAATNYTGFRQAVLLAITDYANSWGDLVPDGGGRLVPTGEIIVPASDVINIALTMMPKTNMVSNDLQNQIQSNGYFSLTLMGKNWTFIPDVTISSGTCFPRFNLLPGISYEKPSMAQEIVNSNQLEHWEERGQTAVYGTVIPAQHRVRGLRITYNAAD